MKSKAFSIMTILSGAMIVGAAWWEVLGELTPLSLGITGLVTLIVTVLVLIEDRTGP